MQPIDPVPPPPAPHPIHLGPMLYPSYYAWYVLVSALDVMVTVKLLVHLGADENDHFTLTAYELSSYEDDPVIASEANTLAQWTIEQFGTWGLIGLKFLSVILVVAICEHVGRRRTRLGRSLAFAAIFLSLLPIVAALIQVGYLTVTGRLIVDDWQEN